MVTMIRDATVLWKGGGKTGEATMTTESGALNEQPFGFSSRFAEQKGTNPEELLAAAHAGCFTMFLSVILEKEHFFADQLHTKAVVTLQGKDDGSFEITESHLTMTAKIPGIDQQKFNALIETAKVGCPVSKALKLNITVDAKLVS